MQLKFTLVYTELTQAHTNCKVHNIIRRHVYIHTPLCQPGYILLRAAPADRRDVLE